MRRATAVLLRPNPVVYLLLRQPVALLLDGVRNQALVAVIPCVDMLLCKSIVEHRVSLAVGLRRIKIGIRLSACGVKDWILVSAQISEQTCRNRPNPKSLNRTRSRIDTRSQMRSAAWRSCVCFLSSGIGHGWMPPEFPEGGCGRHFCGAVRQAAGVIPTRLHTF